MMTWSKTPVLRLRVSRLLRRPRDNVEAGFGKDMILQYGSSHNRVTSVSVGMNGSPPVFMALRGDQQSRCNDCTV